MGDDLARRRVLDGDLDPPGAPLRGRRSAATCLLGTGHGKTLSKLRDWLCSQAALVERDRLDAHVVDRAGRARRSACPRSCRRRPCRRSPGRRRCACRRATAPSSVVTMKNCEPLVFGPALAIASAPRTILWSLNSSSNCVAGAAGAGALRAAALDHEVLDDAVEDQAVVEALAGELLEVRDGLRRVLVEELEGDRALAGAHRRVARHSGHPRMRQFGDLRRSGRSSAAW